MSPLKVCFISLRSYPLFVKKSQEYFGGAEVQVSLIAQELAKDQRFQVSMIVGNYGQKPVTKFGRLTFFKTNKVDFLKILRKTNADIYIERTLNPKILVVGLWCKIFRKKLVYMVAHDWDCTHQTLKLAHLVIAQHQGQQKLLKNKLNIDSVVMRPIIKPNRFPSHQKKFNLWVGRADDWKRPLKLIDLAEANPREEFVMICRRGANSKLFNLVKQRALTLSNLRFLQAVTWENILDWFRQAKVLINTSTAEGWPNTFLQAGATGTPVLSFKVNPENYLNRYGCGVVGRKLVKVKKDSGLNHYLYVQKYHSLSNLKTLKRLLCRL